MSTHEIIFAPKNGWPIRSLYVFLSVDPDGDEGVCAQRVGERWFPMMVTRPALLETLKQEAERLSRVSGKRIVLVEFKRGSKELWATGKNDENAHPEA